jgi:hypothetical protein
VFVDDLINFHSLLQTDQYIWIPALFKLFFLECTAIIQSTPILSFQMSAIFEQNRDMNYSFLVFVDHVSNLKALLKTNQNYLNRILVLLSIKPLTRVRRWCNPIQIFCPTCRKYMIRILIWINHLSPLPRLCNQLQIFSSISMKYFDKMFI